MSLRTLGIAAVTVLVTLGVISAFVGIHATPSGGGTLLVSLSSRSGDSLGDTQIAVHSAGGGWSALAHLANTAVPPAPKVARRAPVSRPASDHPARRKRDWVLTMPGLAA